MSISDHDRLFLNALAMHRSDCQDRPIIRGLQPWWNHRQGNAETIARFRASQTLEKGIYFNACHHLLRHSHWGATAAEWAETLRRLASAFRLETTKSILLDVDASSESSKIEDLGEIFSFMLAEKNIKVFASGIPRCCRGQRTERDGTKQTATSS